MTNSMMSAMIHGLMAGIVLAGISSAHAADAGTALPVQRHVFPSGLVLLVSEQRTLPLIDVEILLDAGSRRDPGDKQGLANLTASLLNEGTQAYSATELAEAVDSLGAQLHAASGIDSAAVRLRVLRDDFEAGMTLLEEILLRPSFPQDELERRRTEILAGMRAAEDRPGHVAYREFLAQVFGADPYGHLVEGTPESVPAIERDDVVSFYQRHYGPERAILTVVGDVDAAAVRAHIEKLLEQWPARAGARFAFPKVVRKEPKVTVVQRPLTQTNVIIGHRGIARTDPDFYAVEVMNHILGGGGFGSRLLDRVRTEAGLAYSVSSRFSTPEAPGSFRITLQTAKESTVDAVRRTCGEILRIREEGVSAEELEAAQLYLTGNFPLQLDSNRKIAAFLTEIESYDLGWDYAARYRERILAVTLDEVLRAAQNHVRPHDLHLVLVGEVTWDHGERLDCRRLLDEEGESAE